MAGLSTKECDRSRRLDGWSQSRTRASVDAARHIDRENGDARCVHLLDDARRCALERAGQASAEQRIDDQVGLGLDVGARVLDGTRPAIRHECRVALEG